MSVTLRTEILPTDLTAMMRWLANPHVSHNLNEHEQITAQLHQIYDARLPVLTPLFNQNGRFWMIDQSFERPVGFLRAVYGAENSVEMVIAIGDEALWGAGPRQKSSASSAQGNLSGNAKGTHPRPYQARQHPFP